MLYFDQIDVSINETGLLAESASLSVENGLETVRAVGRKGTIATIPAGPLRNSFSVNYVAEVTREPNLGVLNSLKTIESTLSYDPLVIKFGGLSGSFFLEGYSLKFAPNDVARASVTYQGFTPLSGSLRASGMVDPPINVSGLMHGWTTFSTTPDNFQRTPVLAFDYSFRANWEPVYVVGRAFPLQVQYLGADESMSFTTERFSHLPFSGQAVVDHLGFETPSIQAVSLSFVCDGNDSNLAQIDITNAQVKNKQVGANIGGVMQTTSIAIKSY